MTIQVIILLMLKHLLVDHLKTMMCSLPILKERMLQRKVWQLSFLFVAWLYFTSHWLLHLACVTAGLHQVMGGTRAKYLLWVKMNLTMFDCNFLCLLTLMSNNYYDWETKKVLDDGKQRKENSKLKALTKPKEKITWVLLSIQFSFDLQKSLGWLQLPLSPYLND